MPAFSLAHFARQLKGPVFFVQVGAMDGKTHDPIYELVRSFSWHGILVEPLKDHFEKLKENYIDCTGLIFENAAIADYTGIGTMYRIPTQAISESNLPRWGLEAGSLFRDRNALAWEEIKPYVIEEQVACLKLSDLLSKHDVKNIDVLQLDAEGFDWQILRQLNFTKFRPSIINIEIVNMSNAEYSQCRQLLDNHDYIYSKTGYDLLAVSAKLL